MGSLYIEKKDYAKAIEYLQRYAQVAPNDENPYESMGGLYLEMNDYPKSIEMYQKVLQITPDHHWGLTGLARNYLKMGDYDKARDQLYRRLETAKLYPNRQGVYHALATLSIAEGDVDNALHFLSKRSEIIQQESDIDRLIQNYFFTVEILFENGKIAEAEKELETLRNLIETADLTEGEKNLAIRDYLTQAICLSIAGGNILRAKELYGQYCNTMKNNPEHSAKKMSWEEKLQFALSGLIALTEGNYEKAISDLILSELKDPWTNYYLALAYQKKGDKAKAIEKLESTVNYYGGPSIENEIYRRRAQEQLAILKTGP
jgi:tetratricopeptide (TPR) repeat protein